MAITDYPITTKFQEKDWFHPNPHSGIDYALPLNTPLEAISDGMITSISTNDILGNNIRYKTSTDEIIVYGHLSEFKVKEGDYIHKGDIIGLSGGMPGMQGAGHSTGPHLHLSVYSSNGTLMNPIDYMSQVQNNNSSPFLFPIMLILLFIILWKFKKVIVYSVVVIMGLFVIFIVS